MLEKRLPSVLASAAAVVGALLWPLLLWLGLPLGDAGIAAASGASILGAAFLLSWAVEAAEGDVPPFVGLTVLALVGLLPEYAVDATFAWRAAADPQAATYVIANMTGGNRLLLGLGWPLVALVGALVLGRRATSIPRSGTLALAALALGAAWAVVPATLGRLTLLDTAIYLGLYAVAMTAAVRADAAASRARGRGRAASPSTGGNVQAGAEGGAKARAGVVDGRTEGAGAGVADGEAEAARADVADCGTEAARADTGPEPARSVLAGTARADVAEAARSVLADGAPEPARSVLADTGAEGARAVAAGAEGAGRAAADTGPEPARADVAGTARADVAGTTRSVLADREPTGSRVGAGVADGGAEAARADGGAEGARAVAAGAEGAGRAAADTGTEPARADVADEEGDADASPVGPAALIADLPRVPRWLAILTALGIASAGILLAAEPFAQSLIAIGRDAGIEEFVLVQWVAPIASEAPELVVAVLLALGGHPGRGLVLLITAKVNQWTLLVGTMPLLTSIAAAEPRWLPLDARQVGELGLTVAQTALGVALVAGRSLGRAGAVTLLVLYVAQLALPSAELRWALTLIYLVLAGGTLLVSPSRRAGVVRLIVDLGRGLVGRLSR